MNSMARRWKWLPFADEIGVDRIGLMEHHGSDDGYLPQPFTLVGGMAAVTKNIRFILGAGSCRCTIRCTSRG